MSTDISPTNFTIQEMQPQPKGKGHVVIESISPESDNLEKMMPRCKTKDTHDFPELLHKDDGSRCWNCRVWEAIDGRIQVEVEKELNFILKNASGGGSWRRLIISRLATRSTGEERKQSDEPRTQPHTIKRHHNPR